MNPGFQIALEVVYFLQSQPYGSIKVSCPPERRPRSTPGQPPVPHDTCSHDHEMNWAHEAGVAAPREVMSHFALYIFAPTPVCLLFLPRCKGARAVKCLVIGMHERFPEEHSRWFENLTPICLWAGGGCGRMLHLHGKRSRHQALAVRACLRGETRSERTNLIARRHRYKNGMNVADAVEDSGCSAVNIY